MSWISKLFGRKKSEFQLDAELTFHVEEEVRRKVADGMNPDKARRLVQIEFGGMDQVKEECRDVAAGIRAETVARDIRHGFRSLLRARGFSLTVLATLGLGIGATAAIFSFIDGVMLRPVAFPDSERLVRLTERTPDKQESLVSTQNFLDWEHEATSFESMADQRWGWVVLTGAGVPREVYCERVSPHFYEIFKQTPLMGRLLLPGDDQPGHDRVLIINHSFWVSQFASDPDIVGKTVKLDGQPYTVIGVMREGVSDDGPAKMVRPLSFGTDEKSRSTRWLLAWGKLKPGVSVDQAQAEMDAISAHLSKDFPKENTGWSAQVIPAKNGLRPDIRYSLFLLMGAACLVLLIACANIANLSLARGSAREREMAVRTALGAGRSRLLLQLLVESLILAAGGGLVGLAVAYGGVAWLKALVPSHYLPPATHVAVDGRILVATAGLAVATGIGFGLYPALSLSRPGIWKAVQLGGLGSSTGRTHQRVRSVLVVAQIATSLILLGAAGIVIRSFIRLQETNIGFTASHLVSARLPIYGSRFAGDDDLRAYQRRIIERLGALPGVDDVALTTVPPLSGWGFATGFEVPGTKRPRDNRPSYSFLKVVSPSYADTLGLRLIKGRFLDEKDVNGSELAVVLNESMAKECFGDADPLGRQVMASKPAVATFDWNTHVPWQVVGVVADERTVGLSYGDQRAPGMYTSYKQCSLAKLDVLVRSPSNLTLLRRELPAAIHEVDPDQPIEDLKTLKQIEWDSLGDERLHSLLLGVFATIAVLVSSVGLFGVMSYSVGQRTREMGIRAAMGAEPRTLLWLIFRHGLLLVCAGLLLGIAVSLGVSQVLSAVLLRTEQFAWSTIAAIISAQAVVGLLACYIPARRALRVDPIVALRFE